TLFVLRLITTFVAVLVMVIFASGTTAPLLSRTVPEIVPRSDCAKSSKPVSSINAGLTRPQRWRIIGRPPYATGHNLSPVASPRNPPMLLTPESIVRPDVVPLRRRFKVPRLEQMLFHDVVIERYAQARPLGNRDETAIDDRLLDSFDKIAPPRNVDGM